MFILGITSDCLDITLRLKKLLYSVVDHVLQVLQFLGVVQLFFVADELLRNRDLVILRYLIVLSCIPALRDR